MADIGSLYAQPPSQNTNPLAVNPLQLIDTLQAMQLRNIQIQREQAQLPAASQQPAATLQGTNIDNAQRATALADLKSGILVNGFADLGAMGNKVQPEHIYARAIDLYHRYHDVLSSNEVNTFADSIIKWPGGPGQRLKLLQNQAAGAGAQISRTPTTAPPGYESGSTSLGEINVGGGAVGLGQPVGEGLRQSAAAKRAADLEATAAPSAQYHADLANLKQDSAILGRLGGPSIETERKLNALTTRLGNFQISMSPEQLRAADSFTKISNSISANQSQMLGAATDAGRDMVARMTPSLEQTQAGREAVIDMLDGRQDAVDHMRRAWIAARKAGTSVSDHDVWMDSFLRDFDPRVFMFNRMKPENYQTALDTLDPQDAAELSRKYSKAVALGWVKPLKKVPKPNAQ